MNEDVLRFIKDKIAFCAGAANNCLHKRDFYQAGIKGGNVAALIIVLEKLGYDVQCECTNNIDGTMTFDKIIIDKETIFERGAFYGKR